MAAASAKRLDEQRLAGLEYEKGPSPAPERPWCLSNAQRCSMSEECLWPGELDLKHVNATLRK